MQSSYSEPKICQNIHAALLLQILSTDSFGIQLQGLGQIDNIHSKTCNIHTTHSQCSRFGRKKGIFSRTAEKTCVTQLYCLQGSRFG